MNLTNARTAVVLAAVLFGTSGTASRVGANGLAPTVVAAWRVVIGGTALVLGSWFVGCAPWRYRVAPRALVIGSGTVIGFQIAFFGAVERLGVTQATVLTISSAPIAAALADHVRGRAPLTPRWTAGVLIAVVGVGLMSDGSWTMDMAGWLLAVAAGCCFPVYASVLRSLRTDRPELAAVATVFGGAVPLAAIALLLIGARAPAVGSESGTVLYLGLAATALAYLLWTYGLRLLGVRDTVLITMIEPVTAAALATVVLGEPMSLIGAAGVAAVAAGIAVAATGGGTTADRDHHRDHDGDGIELHDAGDLVASAA